MDGNSIQSNDDYIYDYALENIVTDVLSAISEKVFLYLNSNNILAAVIPLEAEKLPDGIEDLLVPVHETMKNEFGMEITICIGNIVEGYESINLCYESALISSLNSSINHTGKTFHSDEVSNSSEGVQYKVNFKTSLEDYIMRSDTEGIMKEFDVALTMLDNSTIQTVKTYFTHTLMLILDDYSSTFVGKDNTSYQNLIDRIGKINECTNIDIESLKLKYQDFFNMLIQHLASSKKKSSAESIESAKQYIENNYMNPDLSIALLSEKLGITPAYFGKLFSDTTLSSFNDYLTSVRMKKAAVILTTTSISVNKISEMVGIENTNYFYSLFKREFGMTPLSFRQKNSLSE
jgi:YesN/AraC family two-component response regulator